MIHAFLLSVALLAAPPYDDEDGQEAPSVLEVYDLRPVMPRFDGDASWTQSLLTSSADPYSDLERVKLHELYEDEAPDVVVDLLTQILGDELRYEGREIALEGNSRLLVLAPRSVQDQVRLALTAIESAVSASATVSVDVLTLAGEALGDWPADNVMEVAQADRMVTGLLGRGATRRSYELNVGAGRTAGMDLMRRTPFVFDYDVEIAQGSIMYDPIIVDAEAGTRLLLRGVSVVGGLSLSVFFQEGVSGDVKERPVTLRGRIGSEGAGTDYAEGPQVVQQIEVLFRAAAFDTFVPDGKAIVIASQADLAGQKSRQVVVIRQIGGGLGSYHSIPLGDSTRRLVLVNTEVLSPASTHIEQMPWFEEHWSGHPIMTARVGAEPSLFFFDWIKYRFDVWRRMGPWAVAVTDPAWDDDAAEQLQALLAQWKPQTSLISVDVDLHARGSSSTKPVRWSLPILPGSTCGAMIGITSSSFFDYDVEVAQYSGVPDPVQRAFFNGLALSLRPSVGGRGSLTLDVRGIAQIQTEATTPVELKGPLLGYLDLPGFDQLSVNERVTFAREDGKPVQLALGDGAMQGEQPALRLEIRVR